MAFFTNPMPQILEGHGLVSKKEVGHTFQAEELFSCLGSRKVRGDHDVMAKGDCHPPRSVEMLEKDWRLRVH